ncbi:MAG: LapA family protein [Candidatus Eisenbacteria bacterium]|uniref:LapA family protein n=1 Tax=Eiseniibacteriota bacterium TaxID=2212470 RepID=A0A538TTM1_UNCEI|nr:MAG: LapA family protein [Candidatus Eisenbacteria bacterium]TMQ66982.1 MAG: LapA family protein [Candidatus Eisenbacteria bacterium]
MWILRNLVWLLIMIAVVGFAILNVNGRVTEVKLPGAAYVDLPLTLVLFGAFVLGMFLAFVMTSVHYLKGRAAIGRLARENQSLKEELRALRNLPLEDMRLDEGKGGKD